MKLIEDLGKCLVLTYTKWGILLYSWSLDTRTCDIATKSPLCYTPSLTKSRLKMFVELQYVHNGIKVNFWIPKKFNHEIWAYFVKSKLIVERGDVLKTVQYGSAGKLLLHINDQLICSTVPGRCQYVTKVRNHSHNLQMTGSTERRMSEQVGGVLNFLLRFSKRLFTLI